MRIFNSKTRRKNHGDTAEVRSSTRPTRKTKQEKRVNLRDKLVGPIKHQVKFSS